MRMIFAFLVLANLGFFAKVYLLDDQSRPALVAATKPIIAAGNLVLLSEQDPGQPVSPRRSVPTISTQANLSQESNASAASSDLCTIVGPFAQLLHAEYLVERLAALSVQAQITNIEISDGQAYWVYLPPELSKKEALRRLYELQKKNIESYIITSGDLANGISFGRYADRVAAEEKRTSVKNEGYSAEIKTIPKTINEIWVLLDRGAEEKISVNAWADLISRPEKLEKRQNLCLGVASP